MPKERLEESWRIDLMTTVLRLGEEHVPEVIRVLCDAFYDYPVMRYVLGGHPDDYEGRLSTLIHFFVMARVLRNEELLGTMDGADLAATALVSYPGRGGPPAELLALRDEVWDKLDSESRSRYEAFGRACAPFEVEVPHIHLNMIGVSRASQGSGLGRKLMDHVHLMSHGDTSSQGVTLTTEDPANVPLYEHFGYRLVGHVTLSPTMGTWGFFRPD
jgi:GNAT superfamily N-acetyltransferase